MNELRMTQELPPCADLRVRQVIAILDREYAQEASLAALATAAGVSVGRLQHLFKADVRVSIRKYLTRRRLTIAATLLAETPLRISEVALSVSFRDASDFHHAFERQFGVPPREYRKRHQRAG